MVLPVADFCFILYRNSLKIIHFRILFSRLSCYSLLHEGPDSRYGIIVMKWFFFSTANGNFLCWYQFSNQGPDHFQVFWISIRCFWKMLGIKSETGNLILSDLLENWQSIEISLYSLHNSWIWVIKCIQFLWIFKKHLIELILRHLFRNYSNWRPSVWLKP